jgi:DnaK suppressor protein
MNEAGLSEKFVQEQKAKLLKMKTQLMNQMRDTVREEITESEQRTSEEGDIAQNLTNQNIALSVHANINKKLKEINLALYKIENGTYGTCEETGDPIERKRLERQPWARLSITAAEEMERERRHLRAI